MVKGFLEISAAAALLVVPNVARAQSCYDLRAQLNRNTGDAVSIAADYPKTHGALLACFMSNDRQEDANNCANTVLVVACISMGMEDCSDLMSRWYNAFTTYKRVSAEMRRLGCSQ